MATTPTQMRLTDIDKNRLFAIMRIRGRRDLTDTVRWLAERESKRIHRKKKSAKKSSVAT